MGLLCPEGRFWCPCFPDRPWTSIQVTQPARKTGLPFFGFPQDLASAFDTLPIHEGNHGLI